MEQVHKIRVGIRVRPFNTPQINNDSRLCVNMNGNMLNLIDFAEDKIKSFQFDDCFWSHDQFSTDSTGYLVPNNDKYADQNKLFDIYGLQMLNNTWQGHNSCFITYGESGAGKSYTMFGNISNRGMLDLFVEQLFRLKRLDEDAQYLIQVSMMSIYNQKLIDLLAQTRQQILIKENKEDGIYLKGLTKHSVYTCGDLRNKIKQGIKNIEKNAYKLQQWAKIVDGCILWYVVEGITYETNSTIKFCDLAGSERIHSTKKNGQLQLMQRTLNLGIVALNTVIVNLVDTMSGKSKHIPYRDSRLTRLLQNEIGGNCKTTILFAISPSSNRYFQTLSTLRIANVAKRILNKASINSYEPDRIMTKLNKKRQQLIRLLEQQPNQTMQLWAYSVPTDQDSNYDT